MNYICKCKQSNFFQKNYTYWEDRDVTNDELDIIKFINDTKNIKFDKILHIGIGNSYFANKLVQKSNITGITISKKEIFKAESLNLSSYKFFLCDKYSLEFNEFAKKNKFDIIVDVNLKSYSCCKISFNFMMENIFNLMERGSMLITSRNGMRWYKKLKPKLSFNFKKLFHYKLKEIDGNESNILSLDELKTLSNKHNLKMSFDDKLCYLKK